MPPAPRRRMTLLDSILLVGSAAVGLGLYEMAHRTFFQGWIWLTDQACADVRTWSSMEAIVTLCDITVFVIPVVARWTVLLLAPNASPDRPGGASGDSPEWRHAWLPCWVGAGRCSC